MRLDSTLWRVSRASETQTSAAGNASARNVFLLLAVALAGCVGAIDADKGNGNGGGGPQGGGTPTGPGTTTPPPNIAVTGPTTCKADQIGTSPLRRLTRTQYDNSIKALLGVDLGLSKHFSEDELAGPFPGNYFTPVSESQYAQYASAAASAASKTVERLATLLPCATGTMTGAAEDTCSTQFIRQFGRRAYRRPLTDEEVGRYQTLFKAGRAGADFATGITLVTEGMLESPHFLYLIEGPGPLTQHQLAARLSYFLWNAPPDAKLSTLADSGGLATVDALRAEGKRLLADPRAQEMFDDFHLRWLNLTKLDILIKDGMKFPDFETLHPLMRQELTRFTGYVLGQGDGRLETLLTAPFTFANPDLGKLYDVKVTGDWQKVDLDPTRRSGILTQSAFLATHGHEGSAPIFRGIAIREQLFCVDLPPPPPGADNLFPPPSATKTTRERLLMHRVAPDCAACHALMDKLGYGFESFDDIGRYRTTENGVPIDDTAELVGTDVDGPFKGPVELGKKLAKSVTVQKCLTTQWFRYAMGRNETALDQCTMDAAFKRFQGSDFSIPELVIALVESDGFRVRRPEEGSK
jgi:hypothetical protein